MQWIVETRLRAVPGLPREDWRRYAVAPSRYQARQWTIIPRAADYLTRVRPYEDYLASRDAAAREIERDIKAGLTYQPLQPWCCSKCRLRGEVPFIWRDAAAWIWERMIADHARLSPECAWEWGAQFLEAGEVERWRSPAD